MPNIYRYVLAALLAVPLITAQGPPASAPDGASDNQGDESMKDYPQWYSNDYDCVINCMQVFNGVTSRERNSTLDLSWITCITKDCDAKYQSQNVFQGNYIANMWYDTGSIYECDGAPCKPTNSPSSSIDPASTSGTDQHTPTSAVSMPGLTSTSVKTETASSAGSSEPAATDTDGSGGDNSSGGARASWNMAIAVLAFAIVGGAAVVL